MKIVTIGMSPYNLMANGKLHSWIIEDLRAHGHAVCGLVWAHDNTYFVPDDHGTHFYEVGDCKVPIIPFQRGTNNEPIVIYEALNAVEPDVVITIGELADAGFMKAIRMFMTKPFKWISVLSNYQYPISGENAELVEYMDAILCTSKASRRAVANFQGDTDRTKFVGCSTEFQLNRQSHDDHFRFMVNGKNLQADNLAMVMEAASRARQHIPGLELYVHTNVYDQGEYDLSAIKLRFDPHEEFIRLPAKYVSLFDGLSDEELSLELNKSDVFISVPLVSATSLTVFEALACGCFPILSDCGSNTDIAIALEEYFSGKYSRNDFLVRCIQLMTVGETYLNICDPEQLEKKMIWTFKNQEKYAGDRKNLSVFSQQHSKRGFLDSLVEVLRQTKTSGEVLCLETV